MIEISFEINGRRVNPEDIADALEQAILKKVGDIGLGIVIPVPE